MLPLTQAVLRPPPFLHHGPCHSSLNGLHVWFMAHLLFLETILYGIGITQGFLYYQWWPKDPGSIKFAVLIVMMLETIQLCFFFRSSYFRFVQSQAITTLQTAASVLCDVVITIHLCFYLARSKTGLVTTERMLRALAIHAVNRGMLTTITSILTMTLFLVSPHTFWFFLSIAPNSKLYMNSMLAT
ncbi:hypothetical protein C8R46DRAFT_1214140 [Mycena filopes]|nr:hypothetical protein C8R46DRAFT_1214140 [Mycena filopes]